MYAVIKTGGKQYRVSEGDVFCVERLAGDAGTTVVLDQVLYVSGPNPRIGQPLVAGVKVQAEILRQERGPKIRIFKLQRRKTSTRRHLGHRQNLTRIRIKGIEA